MKISVLTIIGVETNSLLGIVFGGFESKTSAKNNLGSKTFIKLIFQI